MRVFGTGTLAALVSRASLAKFLAAHHHFYAELETRLDDAAEDRTPPPAARVASFLPPSFEGPPRSPTASPSSSTIPSRACPHARRRRLRRRHRARRRARIFLPRRAPTPNRALLRALLRRSLRRASMLGWPTKRALGLPRVPEFYRHDDAIVSDRRATYVESVYEAINEVGSGLSGGDGRGGGGGDARISRSTPRCFGKTAGTRPSPRRLAARGRCGGTPRNVCGGPVNRGISSGGWWRGGIRRRGSSRDGEDLSFARSSVARLANRIRARCCRHAGVSFALGFADRENSSPPVIQSAALVFGGR